MILLSIHIVTGYPLWFVIFCLLLGALYAAALYYKENKNEFSVTIKRVMAVLRLISVAFIAFFLLSPLLKLISSQVEKPVIIIAQDNSHSILNYADSSFYKSEYLNHLNTLAEQLKKKYDVKMYVFGEKTREFPTNGKINFSDKETDISSVFEDINNNFSGCNVGAVILASDGDFNKGSHPVYASQNMKFPIYTLALGDTNLRRDAKIVKVNHNRYAYPGNSFPLEIVLNAVQCRGMTGDLKVLKDNEILYSKPISFSSDNYNTTVTVQLEAKGTGVQHYKVMISPLKNEISKANNVQDVFVEILNHRQKILILEAVPHPDISALKQSLENYNDYEVDVFSENEFTGQPTSYNLIILHQVPSLKKSSRQLITTIVKNKIPVLFIIGTQSDLAAFNELKSGLNINQPKSIYNESQAFGNKDFSQFSLNTETWRIINDFPPLTCPFGQYKVQNSANIFLFQKIGSVTTAQPLILLNQVDDVRYGIISGEGIWKWRLADYAQKNNHEAFDEIISKIAQYLSVKEDKSFFRIHNEHQYLENQPVEFSAEVFNDSYEPVHEPDVEMTITSNDGKKFPYTFSKTESGYQLNAGNFPVGVYNFNAKVKVGKNIFEKRGEFIILPLNAENINMTADHKILYDLAKKHDGEMFYPKQMELLADKINQRQDIRSVSFTQKKYTDMIDLKSLFFFILLLLTTEWFLRKYFGGY